MFQYGIKNSLGKKENFSKIVIYCALLFLILQTYNYSVFFIILSFVGSEHYNRLNNRCVKISFCSNKIQKISILNSSPAHLYLILTNDCNLCIFIQYSIFSHHWCMQCFYYNNDMCLGWFWKFIMNLNHLISLINYFLHLKI